MIELETVEKDETYEDKPVIVHIGRAFQGNENPVALCGYKGKTFIPDCFSVTCQKCIEIKARRNK